MAQMKSDSLAKRKNTITKKRYPLFADCLDKLPGFYVTKEQVEQKQIENERDWQQHEKYMNDANNSAQIRADQLRDVIRDLVGDQGLLEIETKNKRIGAAYIDPYFVCNVLIRNIKNIDQQAAYKNCPHWEYKNGLHVVGSYSLSTCPVCGGPVKLLTKMDKPKPHKQLTIFEVAR